MASLAPVTDRRLGLMIIPPPYRGLMEVKTSRPQVGGLLFIIRDDWRWGPPPPGVTVTSEAGACHVARQVATLGEY